MRDAAKVGAEREFDELALEITQGAAGAQAACDALGQSASENRRLVTARAAPPSSPAVPAGRP